MNEQNDSGRTGTATLTEQADGTLRVELSLTGGTDTGAQPAHIREGSCAVPQGVVEILSGLISGSSVTSVPETTLADVRGLIINVVNSSNADISVSCGEIR